MADRWAMSAAAMDRVHPFHVVVDPQGVVARVGPSLADLCPTLSPGRPLEDVLALHRPEAPTSVEGLRRIEGQLCFVGVGERGLQLRGQWVGEADGSFVFVGSPAVARLEDLLLSGLKLSHFAVHDPVAEYLFQLHTREMSLADSKARQDQVARRNRELEAAERDARRQQAVAAEALQQSHQKSSFLASMSHELRTPLNAILGYAELLLDDTGSPPPATGRDDDPPEGDLQRIVYAARQLETLIDDVLDLARVEAGRIDLTPSRVDVEELLGGVHAAVQPLARRAGSRVTTEVGPLHHGVVSDRAKVHQVLLTLTTNALQATRDGEVHLSAFSEGDHVVFEVADTGVGMSKETLARLFRPFVQGEESLRAGHTGLSLTIARLLARLLGGDLTATSALGVGSTFRLALPNDFPEPRARAVPTLPPAGRRAIG